MTDTWPSWLLLDTHIALWLDGGSDRLRASTRSQIDEWWQNGGSVLLSAVSAWEIALLVDTGKITLDLSVEAWVERFTGRPGINVVPLSQHAAARAYRLHHRDPGDRLLIATSSHFPAYWSRMMPGFYSSPRRTEASTGLRLEAEAADRSQGLATGPGPRQPTRRHRMIGPEKQRRNHMRVAIIGQQDFGKATLEAFLARGDDVAAVFCAPEKGRPDPLRLAGEAAGVPTHQFPKLTGPEAQEALRVANVEIGIMAFVTQFVPQDFCNIPKFGTIQFHPSLLPLHRGASSMSWSIILGRKETGFSIFRPTDGLDEGPVILTRTVAIEPEDTMGSLYFGKIFPMGVAGLIEVADMVVAGKAPALAQYEPAAGYEGIIREAESEIHWAAHVDQTFNLIRGCNPAPGAWTMYDGKKLFLFDCTRRLARTFSEVKGKKIGQIVGQSGSSLVIHGQGGFIEVHRVRWDGGKKIAAAEAGLETETILG